mmetsp:Transcript_7501/g.13059  ORF Transcript_7501/g.13059 Transcript_7501/m.13059 type:complete len:551 (+) Transcript_7501:21-1673(+)
MRPTVVLAAASIVWSVSLLYECRGADQCEDPATCEAPAQLCSQGAELCGDRGIVVGSQVFCCARGSVQLQIPREAWMSVECECNTALPNEHLSCWPGEGSVPFENVDDGFCDCGVDELNTPACAGDHEAPWFRCKSEPLSIPASRVVDEICDCCDGSDEVNGNCENTCETTTTSFEAVLLEQKAGVAFGLKRYQDKLVPVLAQAVEKLESEASEASVAQEESTTQLEDIKQVMQASGLQEASMARRSLGKLEGDELDDLMNALGCTSEADAANLAGDLLELKGKPRGNEDQKEPQQKLVHLAVEDLPALELLSKALDKGPEELTQLKAQLESVKEKTKLAKETQKLFIKAKRTLERASKLKNDVERFSSVPTNIQVALDRCISKRLEKYTFKICHLVTCHQDKTLLGNFDHFEGVTEYEARRAWSEFAANLRSKAVSQQGEPVLTPALGRVYYTGGQRCHNGKTRSAVVHMHCGGSDSLVSVREPETCVYEFHAVSPSMCQPWVKDAFGISEELLGAATEPWLESIKRFFVEVADDLIRMVKAFSEKRKK